MDEVWFSYWCREFVEVVFTLQQIRAREWRGGKDWGRGGGRKEWGEKKLRRGRKKKNWREGGKKTERGSGETRVWATRFKHLP